MPSNKSKYLGLKVPDNYDVRYKTFYADLYDINTKSYLGTCKVDRGVTVDYTFRQDLNEDPDLDLYVGEEIPESNALRFKVANKPNNILPKFNISLSITGNGPMEINWGPNSENEKYVLTGTPLTVTKQFNSGNIYQVEVSGASVTDVTYVPESMGHVTKVMSFGEIGLNSVSLYNGPLVSYDQIPKVLSSSITHLDGFCKGLKGINFDTFKEWDFSNVVSLKDFLASTTACSIELKDKTFSSLTTIDGIFKESSSNFIRLESCEFTELVTASMLALSTIRNEYEFTNLTFPKLTTGTYWLAGSDHISLTIKDLDFPVLKDAGSMFGEINDSLITVDGLSTPVLKTISRLFAAQPSNDPESDAGLSIANWNMFSIEKSSMSFSGWSDCDVTVDLSTSNLSSSIKDFMGYTNVVAKLSGLKIRPGGNLEESLLEGDGSTYDCTRWNIGNGSTVKAPFRLTGSVPGTTSVNFSNLTLGNDCVVSGLTSYSTDVVFKGNVVTIGARVQLIEAMAYMYRDCKLTLLQWNIGNNCDLDGLFSFHEAANTTATNWTLGDQVNLSNLGTNAVDCTLRSFIDWTIGTGKEIGKDENLFSHQSDGNLIVRNWIWGTGHNLARSYAQCTDLTLESSMQSFTGNSVVEKMFVGCKGGEYNLSKWLFGGSNNNSIELFAEMTGVVLRNLASWNVQSIVGFSKLAKSSVISGLEGIVGWDVSNGLTFDNAFNSYNPDGTLMDLSNWNLSSAENLDYFAAYSAVIKFDMGRWSVGNVTTASYMFTGQREVIVNQDLTCWDVEKISAQPSGWSEQLAEESNRMPLWGVPMSDMSRRYHSFCRLPDTPDPVERVDNPLKFKVSINPDVEDSRLDLVVTLESVGMIDWGDGSTAIITESGSYSHLYSVDGPVDIEVHGVDITRVSNRDKEADIEHTDDCKVIELNDFGLIGLTSIDLRLVEGLVGYTVLPKTLPVSLTDLTALCRGMDNVSNDMFKLWDFSQVSTLKDTFRECTNLNLDLGSWKLPKLTSMDDTFRETTDSIVNMVNMNLPVLTITHSLFRRSTNLTLTMDRISLPAVIATGLWFEGSTDISANLTELTLNSVKDMDNWLSGVNNINLTVSGLKTPSLVTATEVFAMYSRTDEGMFNTVDIVDWEATSLETLVDTWSKHHLTNTNISFTASTPGVKKASGIFNTSDNSTITFNGLKVRIFGGLSDLCTNAKDTTFELRNWSLGDESTITSAFVAGSDNTFNLSGMTGGDGITAKSLFVEDRSSEGGAVHLDSLRSGPSISGRSLTASVTPLPVATIRTEAVLDDLYNPPKVICNNFSAGSGTEIDDIFRGVSQLQANRLVVGNRSYITSGMSDGSGSIEANDWTLGEDCDISNMFNNRFASDKVTIEANRWKLGNNGTGRSNMFNFFLGCGNLIVSMDDWKFTGNQILRYTLRDLVESTVSLTGWGFASTLDIDNFTYGAGSVSFDVTGWTFGNTVTTNRLFAGITLGSIVGLGSWSYLQFSDLTDMFANSSITEGLSELNSAGVGTVRSLAGMFAGTSYTGTALDLSNWKLTATQDVTNMFNGNIVITWDLGRWNTSAVTEAGSMFSAMSLTGLTQDLTCWDMQLVPSRPRGWEDFVASDSIEPLWGVPMTDLENRSHVFCKLPDVLPPVSEDDLMFKFGLPVESKIYPIPEVGRGRGGPDGPDGPVLQSMGVRNVLADEDWLVLSTVSSGRLYIELKVDTTSETTINWGDGESETITTSTVVSHLYSGLDTRDITISGTAVTQVEIVSQPEDGQVTEINSFGLIGLKALHLTNRDARLPPSYNVVPKTLPATIEDLSSFLAGFHNVTNETIGQWDFSNVKYLDGFLAGGYSHDLTFENITFTNLVSMSYSLLTNAKSNIRFINCKFPKVTRLEDMMSDSYMTNLSMTDCNYPLVTKVSDFVKFCNLCNVTLDGLTLDVAKRLDDFLGVTYDTNVSINNLKTPRLSEIAGAFSRQLTLNNFGDIGGPELQLMSVSEVEPDRFVTSVTNWDTPNLRGANNLFSGSNFHDITLSFKSHGLFYLGGPWAFTNDCNITCTDMTFGNDVTVSSLFTGNQWNNYDLRNWTFGTGCEVKTSQTLD